MAVTAGALVLATGARERPRAARMVPGDRPQGVLTTGQLQNLVHLKHRSVGSHAVVVGAEWDFEGLGDYPIKEQFDPGRRADRLTLQRTHTFTRPGTYFPALRASSQHPGDAGTIFARPQNLGRVRVVVQ